MAEPADRTAADAGDIAVLRLKRHEERRLLAGHLWVFSNEIDTDATPLTAFEPGAIVAIESDRGRFLGFGYVNPHSLISARILSRDPARRPGEALIAARLRRALALRQRFSREPFYRLVHGEGDGLPGLVVDRYGGTLVAQLGTAGMERLKGTVLAALVEVVAPECVVFKNDSGARALEGLDSYVECALGTLPEAVEVRENGASFRAPLASGQKTGWFYDQAANRRQFLELATGSRRVLDVFSYVGAWGVQAARQGGEVLCVDSSAGALEAAAANAARNGVALATRKADAFAALEELAAGAERFDLVIVDPPAFIKRRKDAPKGEAAYRRLNQLAIRLLADDGLLVSCSCSYHLEPQALVEAIQAGARHHGRFAQVLASGGQAPDHPVHPAIPESRYLKAFLCRLTQD